MSCSRGCCASFAEHVRSLTVRPTQTATSRNEQQLSKDLDAYKRQRAMGLQPKTVTGAADLARAESPWEMEAGVRIRNERFRQDFTERLADPNVQQAATAPLESQ